MQFQTVQRPEPVDRFASLKHLIGNTPLLSIRFLYRGEERMIHAKAEHVNLTGSIKDRMAFHVLEQAWRSGTLKPGDRIVEATSGNTGIAFASLGRALGHEVIIFMPDWMSRERVDLIRSLGAKVMPVTREQGGFVGSIRMTEELAGKEERIFLPCQFSNRANVEAHERTTGPELWWQLQACGLEPDAFVAGVGTGGTIMGVGKFLRSVKQGVRIHPLEPAESPVLTAGRKIGHHRIQGISDEFVPSIIDLGQLDEIIAVNDGDAILMAQKLSSRLGLALGISSGANFLGALIAQNKLGKDAVVATVFADDNKKYLSTDLLREEPVRPEYLSPDVELLSYGSQKRVCHICCDFGDCTQKL